MAVDQANDARLGWLLIPDQRSVDVWTSPEGPESVQGVEPCTRVEEASRLEAGEAFPGLVLELKVIWAS